MRKPILAFIAPLLICIAFVTPVFATNYYVDNTNGSDSNNGLTPANAWQSLTKVNGAAYAPGDSILFNRGGVWRGQLIPESGTTAGYITYADYGSGPKPALLGSVNKSDTADWVSLGNNIWQCVQPSPVDIGNLIFNGGTGVGFKKWTSTDLLNQGDFWWDKTGTHAVRIYSVINPGSFYTDIEAALGSFIIYAQLDSFTVIQNLAIRYGGADGIEVRNTHHFTLRGCDVSFIGGTELTTRVRYGGGIQFWAYSNNNTVERCRFWEIYDDAVTNQTNNSITGTAQQYNIVYRNNLIWNCSESSFCCFLRPGTVSGSFLKNIYFENNTCVNAGGGWAAAQRPDLKGFQIYFSATTAATDSVFIRNNIFYRSRCVLFVDNSSVQTLNHTITDYNCWYTDNSTDTMVAFWTSGSLAVYTQPQFAAYQTGNNQDLHSFVADPLMVNAANNDYHLTAGSPCINSGANTGISTDFDLNPRPQNGTYDIGSYEYTTTGVQQVNRNNPAFKIYPNPASGTFTFESPEQHADIEIYSTAGEMVYKTAMQNKRQTIDLAGVAAGTYIVRLTTGKQEVYNNRIVITK